MTKDSDMSHPVFMARQVALAAAVKLQERFSALARRVELELLHRMLKRELGLKQGCLLFTI